MGVLVNLGSHHLGDSDIPVPDQEEELSGGSGSTAWMCVYVCVCVWSSYLHSESVANHWTVNRQQKDTLAEETSRLGALGQSDASFLYPPPHLGTG